MFYDGDYVNLTNVIYGTTVCQSDLFEWFLKGTTPEGKLALEKRAIYDWLSSTCEIEELRFPVLRIYDFVCFCLFYKV